MATIAILTPISNAYQGDIQAGADVKSRIAGATLTNGQVVYDDPTTGTAKVSDATGGATLEQVTGMVIEGTTKLSGQSVTIMRRGVVAGFDLSGLNFGALVYLDVTGTIATVANGTKTVVIGKVVASPNRDYAGNVVKLLAVNFADLSNIS